MEIKEFIQNFADQFDEVDVETLNGETEFRMLDEWSSMMGLAIMAMVDDEYNVQIKADELRKAETIQDVYDLVNSKLEA